MQSKERTTPGSLFTVQRQMLTPMDGVTCMDIDQVRCIHTLFEAQVEKTPEAVAVIFENQTLTYQALNNRANQLANHLIKHGVGPDVLVGLCMERSFEMIVGLLAILKAGGAYVPLDPAYPAERLAFILDETQAPLLLTQAHLVGSLPSAAAQVICLDSDWQAISQNTPDNPVGRACDNLMYVIYTSGSTGQPKGVMIPHAGIWNQLDWRQTTFPLTAADRVLQSISFSFDPSVWQIFWPLAFGAQLVLPVPDGQKELDYLIQLMAQQQVTVMALVPSMLRVLLAQPALDHCTALKHVFCGGEALPSELIETFYQRFRANTQLHNVYGPTEASIDATFWTCQPHVAHRFAPIGRAITHTHIHILDPHLQPVAVGEAGELHISGAGLARGYLNRAALTAEKFIPHPHSEQPNDRLYKTGDLARLLPDGNLEFLGRLDHQVKIRGFRIELGEIETALQQHALLAEAVVVPREDAPGQQRLVAYVVPATTVRPKTAELRRFLYERLPDYMVPSAFVVLKALPLNANLKLDRTALPAPDSEAFALASAFAAPQDALELELTQLWEQILNIRPIGVKDDFFTLGGDSLLATSVLAHIETVHGQKLPLAVFQEAATVETLAAFMRQQDGTTRQQPLVPIQPQGTKPPLFCMHSRNHHVLNYYPLARQLPPNQPVYGLQPRTTDADLIAQLSVEAIAADYIDEIRAIQPHGPYFLLGYSFGGLVAYEMARQLAAHGEPIALLAMVDTYNVRGPWFTPVSKHLHFFSRLAIQAKMLRKRLNPVGLYSHLFEKLAIDKEARNKGTLREKAAHTWKILVRALNPKTVTIESAYAQITQKYIPQVYPGQAILFRTTSPFDEQSNLMPATVDTLLGWSETVGSLEVYELPCNHFNVVYEPFVQHLAQGLQTYLDQAQQTQGYAEPTD